MKKAAIISPGVFLPAAERYNLIEQLDRWVIEKALKFTVSKSDHFSIKSNLSL